MRTHCGQRTGFCRHFSDTVDKIADCGQNCGHCVLVYTFESCMIKYIYSYLRTYIFFVMHD
jgi:hypothetical protein